MEVCGDDSGILWYLRRSYVVFNYAGVFYIHAHSFTVVGVTGVLRMEIAVRFLLFRVKEILLLYGIELEIAIETGAKGANLTNDSEFTKSGRPIE